MRNLVVGFLFGFSILSVCHAESTEEMLSACQDISTAQVKEGKVTLPKDFDSGVCWGAFSILQDMTRQALNGERLYRVCSPVQSTRTQLIAIFVTYAKSHPERYSEPVMDVAFEALQKAFPCKPSPKGP